jgi:hypothetical protein
MFFSERLSVQSDKETRCDATDQTCASAVAQQTMVIGAATDCYRAKIRSGSNDRNWPRSARQTKGAMRAGPTIRAQITRKTVGESHEPWRLGRGLSFRLTMWWAFLYSGRGFRGTQVAPRATDVIVIAIQVQRSVPMRHVFPPEVDRAFLVEALCAAGEYFRALAKEASDAEIHEEYYTKRARCLRLVVDLKVDLNAHK